jgi:hypothetical protein
MYYGGLIASGEILSTVFMGITLLPRYTHGFLLFGVPIFTSVSALPFVIGGLNYLGFYLQYKKCLQNFNKIVDNYSV